MASTSRCISACSHRRLLERMPGGKHAERLLKLNTRNIGWHGNALLVKRHIGVLDVAALDLPTLEPRGAVMAELLIGDRPIRVDRHAPRPVAACGGGGRCARSSMRSTERPQKMPTVLMGDTNEWRDAAGCLKELERRLSHRPDRPELPRPPAGRRARPDHRRPRPRDRGGRRAHAAPRRGARPTICRSGRGWRA